MKNKYLVLAFIVTSLLLGCSKDDAQTQEQQVRNLVSQICPEINSYEGLYWDFAHTLPIPLTEVPLIQNPGQQFIHSLQPIIGFTIPQGFTAFEVTNNQTGDLGVNVIRNDNAVVFRWMPASRIFSQVAANDILANEINSMFAFYGFNGTPEVICSTNSNSSFGGFPSQFAARLLRFNGITAQVWVSSKLIAGATYSAISVTAAPSQEYDAQVAGTFLPINWQLLIGPDGEFVDNDGDGVTADRDPDDNNPDIPE